MVTEEADEFVRIVCGKLIRTMIGAGVERDNLWPASIDKKLYEAFPDTSQYARGWHAAFQDYVDEISMNSDHEPSVFASSTARNKLTNMQNGAGPVLLSRH